MDLIMSMLTWPNLLMVLSIMLLECLLSVDNAAVLATMVIDLPKDQRSKALKYGIIGAYVARGIMLFFAAFLVRWWFLKPIGGIYLMYLAFSYFKGKTTEKVEDDYVDKKSNWLYRSTVGALGVFWSTVALVEVMDIAFSIDNVFAVVAFSKNIWLIVFGVFVGILAMRFVAQAFVKLLEKYKFLEDAAFTVIGLLGIKLALSLVVHFFPNLHWLESETADWCMSALTILIFLIPIITSKLFDYPKRSDVKEFEDSVIESISSEITATQVQIENK